MKSLYFHFIIALVVLIGCAKNDPATSLNAWDPHELPQGYIPIILSLPDAEKILGEAAHVTDSTLTIKEDVNQYLLTYTAKQVDTQTGKTGNLYYMFEQYDDASGAQKSYTSIKKSNENHEGVEVLQGVGDEAYFHSDSENFYFILIRKGKHMIRMKVNKITSNTSLEEFNAVARNITSALPG